MSIRLAALLALCTVLAACDSPSPSRDIMAPNGGPALLSEAATHRSDGDADFDNDNDGSLRSLADAEWSAPVNVGAPVNSAFNDQAPALSNDGLALYFTSDRPGGVGNFDIWVSRRASDESLWEAAVNLGPLVNTSLNDGTPALSADGHLLFLLRPSGGTADIYVSHRRNPADDLGWGPPVPLGPDVNTVAFEVAPFYFNGAHGDAGGSATLYFTRGSFDESTRDIYAAPMTQRGEALGLAVLVSELSHPNANDGFLTGRPDGREVFFSSNRPGALSGPSALDIWTSTRSTVRDVWSTPANLGAPVNTGGAEFSPDLSHDGRTLLFVAGAARGGLGGSDIWMSTRVRPGQSEP